MRSKDGSVSSGWNPIRERCSRWGFAGPLETSCTTAWLTRALSQVVHFLETCVFKEISYLECAVLFASMLMTVNMTGLVTQEMLPVVYNQCLFIYFSFALLHDFIYSWYIILNIGQYNTIWYIFRDFKTCKNTCYIVDCTVNLYSQRKPSGTQGTHW